MLNNSERNRQSSSVSIIQWYFSSEVNFRFLFYFLFAKNDFYSDYILVLQLILVPILVLVHDNIIVADRR